MLEKQAQEDRRTGPWLPLSPGRRHFTSIIVSRDTGAPVLVSKESRAENPVPVDTFWRSELQNPSLDNEEAEAKGNWGLLKSHTASGWQKEQN